MIKGYTTGVFDLFHIGHLNILKAAKSQCDHLIVGVTTDELSLERKGKLPIIPFDERVSIIKSIKYVDEVVPQETMDKRAAWAKYKFDKMFVGDDWKGTDKWNSMEKEFDALGVAIVYFPYTKDTSSTLIREVLNGKVDNTKENKSSYIIDFTNNKSLATKIISKVTKEFELLNIDYWIEYGTLLGAVREKGFIPWDSEFDVGIWHSDYLKHKAHLDAKFREFGFNINYGTKDRVKLIHNNLMIGAYFIDIHTYHLNNDTAYVSFGGKRNKFLYSLYSNIRKALIINDRNAPAYYRMSNIIKLILMNQAEIPDRCTLIPGRYNYLKSFKLNINGCEYDNDKLLLNKNGFLKKLMINAFSYVPDNIRKRLILVLDKAIQSLKDSDMIQAIPAHFYQNLDKIKFEDIVVSCPKNNIEYVKHIYGAGWNIRQKNWKRTQNKINVKMNGDNR